MSIHTISSRDFTRDVASAKQWIAEGAVFTDRGQAAHVLLSFEEYHRLTGKKRSLSMLAMDSGDDIAFEPAGMDLQLRDADRGTERDDTGGPDVLGRHPRELVTSARHKG